MSKVFFKGVLAAFLGAVLTCGSALAADTIKIGVPGAHSGELASYGLQRADFSASK